MTSSATANKAPRNGALRPGLLDGLLIAAVALAGVALCSLGYRTLRDAEALRQEEILGAAVQTVLSSVELELTRATEATRNGGLMLEQQPQLRRADFNRYAQGLIRQLPSVGVLEWQPLVPASARAQFELDARAQGLQGYRVVEPDEKNGTWLPAPPRDHYVPILYAWPEQGAALGYNLATSPLRMSSKLQAAALGEPVASESFRVLYGDIASSSAFGFAITAPVFANSPAETAAQSRALRGYLAAVIELPPLLKQAAERANAAHLDLLVFDKGMSLSKPIFAGIGPDSDLRTQAGEVVQTGRPRDHIKTLDVAHRSWHVVLHPRPAFFAALPSSYAGAVLGVGLLATLLLSYTAGRILQDRRKLLNAQRSLIDERQRLQNVIEGTGAGSWEYDFESDQMWVNDRWCEIAGLKPADYRVRTGYRWQEDCHPDDLPVVSQLLLKHLNGESPAYVAEFRRRHLDGRWIWVSARGKVMRRDGQGRALTIAGTMVEIEARKQAEARILELNSTLEQRVAERSAELEEAMLKLHHSGEALFRSEARAALNTMVASVSHELSTPMSNSLIGASTLAAVAKEFQRSLEAGGLRRSELNQFVAQVLEGSELAVRNMERATDLMRSFRQVAADQASEQRRDFDLRMVMQELLDALAPGLRLQPHRISLEIPEGLKLDSYPGPLEQALTNLINNAYLHAFEGMSAGELHISAVAAGPDHVRIICRDNGCGMDAATLDKLFTPFFSTKIGRGGSGLGISIVNNLVTKTLGGSLTIESTPGRGTTVSITLPVKAPTPKP
ncbi:CHASE domain-containing protein [Paucibacter sp. AS339]|uniref:CHASE domain-containing protein n=1 Tax=Paucibacter hankyongi TaxID=3133434 RepID=UPI00309B38EB